MCENLNSRGWAGECMCWQLHWWLYASVCSLWLLLEKLIRAPYDRWGWLGIVSMSHSSGEHFIPRLYPDFLNGQRSKQCFWCEQYSFINSCLQSEQKWIQQWLLLTSHRLIHFKARNSLIHLTWVPNRGDFILPNYSCIEPSNYIHLLKMQPVLLGKP